MLKARILTAAVLLAGFLICLFYLPAEWWNFLLLLVLAVAAREWSGLAHFSPGLKWLYVLMTVAVTLGLLLADDTFYIYPFLFAAVFWVLLAPLWLGFGWHARHRLLMAITGWLVLIPTMLALAQLHASPWRLLALMAVVWLADSAAYFSGRRFGKHKLAPAISPGKTWEGAVGALLLVAIYGTVLFSVTALPSRLFGGGLFGFLAFVAALWLLTGFSILGDLFESWMKRQAGVKDSGAFLPGHGGLLDRIDALTSTLPLAAFALTFAG
jgi:phosphatidate cytidylyltransferase